MSDRWHALITEVEPAPAKAGPLHGKRLLVKDLIDTAGIRTTYGSRIYADHVPARTAPAVRRLVDAGAVVVGKANLHEFAWGVTPPRSRPACASSASQPTRAARSASPPPAAASSG